MTTSTDGATPSQPQPANVLSGSHQQLKAPAAGVDGDKGTPEQGWRPDILGGHFQARTLALGNDSEGPVFATIVRSLVSANPATNEHSDHKLLGHPPLADVDVLYVHGWSDYYFQKGLATYWNTLGADFYALDLRKYGRSLRKWQTPGYTDTLTIYDQDIKAALDQMGTHKRGRRLVLLGHSTGGLTLTLWASRHRGQAAALVLNSPWLEFQTGNSGRVTLAPLVKAQAMVDPKAAYPDLDLGYYTRAQQAVGSLPKRGYRHDWRPKRGFVTRPGWLNAIFEGQKQLWDKGANVGCPTLVLLSAHHSVPFGWSDAMKSSDSVLVVDDIAQCATRIHPSVTIDRIDGALHDVFISAAAPREAAYRALSGWLMFGEMMQPSHAAHVQAATARAVAAQATPPKTSADEPLVPAAKPAEPSTQS